MSNSIKGMYRSEGVILLDTTEANRESVEKFKDALNKLIDQYISTTSINRPEVMFNEAMKGELTVIYAYDNRDFEEDKKVNIFEKVYLAKTGKDFIHIFVYLTLEKNNLNMIKVKP